MQYIAVLSYAASALALEGIVARQNGPPLDNSTTPPTCHHLVHEIRDGKTYNATGNLPLGRLPNSEGSPQHEGTWYLSMGLSWNDTSAESSLDLFISVPQPQLNYTSVRSAQYCALALAGQSQTWNGEPHARSCDNVISDDCREALRGATRAVREQVRCRFQDHALDEIEAQCGGRPLRAEAFLSPFLNTTEPDCQLEGVPGVDIPSGYATFADKLASIDLGNGEDALSYDMRVAQTIPIVLISRFDPIPEPLIGSSTTGLTSYYCLSPSNVTDGSQEVSARPWDEEDNEGSDGDEGDEGDTEGDDENVSTMSSGTTWLGLWMAAIGGIWALML